VNACNALDAANARAFCQCSDYRDLLVGIEYVRHVYYCTPITIACQVFVGYTFSDMRWLIIAIIVLAQQPVKPPESNRAPKSKTAQNAQKSHAADQEQNNGTAFPPAPSQIQQIFAQNPQGKTLEASDDVKIQGRIVIFTGLLVLVGFLQAGVMFLQWCVYRRQASEMRRQRHVMWKQWKTMSVQSEHMGAQLAQMQAAGVQTNDLIVQAKIQTEKTGIAAEAAKKSADISARVSIPTLKVERFVGGETGVADIKAFLQHPKVSISIKNFGQTPAFLQWWSIMFTCKGLPEIPVYGGNSYGMPLDKQVVQPNNSYTLPDLNFIQRPQISLQDVQAIIRREKVLIVYGYICYGDIFDNPLRRLKFCEFTTNVFDNKFGSGFNWCQETDPRYSGTDLLPVRNPSSGQGVEGQPSCTDAEAENNS
jgi:hypothetical protein